MIWWIVFGVVAIAFVAWIWWELQHAIEVPPNWTGDTISRISQAIDQSEKCQDKEFEKWHAEAVAIRSK